jgi:hypothetical protein
MERNSMVAILGTHREGKSANGCFEGRRYQRTLLSCGKAGGSTAIVFELPHKYSFFGVRLVIFNRVSWKNAVLRIFAHPISPKVDPASFFDCFRYPMRACLVAGGLLSESLLAWKNLSENFGFLRSNGVSSTFP